MATWFYLESDQECGSANEEEFRLLVQDGAIHDETFLWCEGMPGWKRYRELRDPNDPAPIPAEPRPGNRGSGGLAGPAAACTDCGTLMDADQLWAIGGAQLCPKCRVARRRLAAAGSGGGRGAFANPFVRGGCFILDGLICGLSSGLAFVALTLIASAGRQNPEAPAWLVHLALVAMVIWSFYYFVVLIASSGATPAMRLAGIRVVSADGGRISIGRAFGRFLLIALITNLSAGLGHLVVFFDRQKRSVHDIVCRTVVIKD